MKKLLGVLVAVAFSTAAQAQSMKIEVDPGSMGINVNGASAEVSVTHSQVEEREEDGFKLRYESNPGGKTQIKVLAPEGARVEIWDGQRKLVDEDIPVSVQTRGDAFHRIIIHGGRGLTWEKKLSTKPGMAMSLWVAAPSRHAERPPPPPPPPPSGPEPMSGSDFSELKAAISGESFSEDQLGVLRTAAGSALFSAEQVGELIDIFSFSEDKLNALSIVKNKIVDRQNNFKIFKHFTFSADKEKAQAMLR